MTGTLLQAALAAHRAGRLPEAEALYRQVLAADPAQIDALHLLGVLAQQAGQPDLAVELIGRAVARQPDYVAAQNNLGNALLALGRLEAAAERYRLVLRLKSDEADAARNLGVVLRQQGRPAEAVAQLEAALALRRDVEGLNELGLALASAGRFEDALVAYRAALDLRPDFAAALNNLGMLLGETGRPEEAERHFRAALELDPGLVAVWSNLGNTLCTLDQPAAAEACYREALRLRPDHAEARGNLGHALANLGRHAEAATSYRAALAQRPDDDALHHSLGQALLLTGQFEAGWAEHERRRHSRNFVQPLWMGEPLDGKILLLHAEGGLGDTIQFCRYARSLPAGRQILLEVPPALRRLMEGLADRPPVIARSETLPPFDLHCPLMSLPHRLGIRLDTIRADIPYLAAEPELIAAWRERLAGLAGLRIGLAWSGNPAYRADRRRSLPLARLAPLFEVPGITFVSLQKGEAAAQAADQPRLLDPTALLTDFAETAALVETLDLVISVDTAIAHLAGALGKPIWLLNSFDPHWVWLLDRSDSPWYPSLRQFRQSAPGDWDGVVAKVARALAAR